MRTAAVMAAVASIALAGCPKPPPPPPPPTYTVTVSGTHGTQTFTGVDRTDISSTDRVVLYWDRGLSSTSIPGCTLQNMWIEPTDPKVREKPIPPRVDESIPPADRGGTQEPTEPTR